MAKKQCLATLCYGNFVSIREYMTSLFKEYCYRQNLDLIVMDSNPIAYKHYAYGKLKAFDLLCEYNSVVYIDMDIYIYRNIDFITFDNTISYMCPNDSISDDWISSFIFGCNKTLLEYDFGNVDKISSLICDNQNQYKNSVGDIDDESYLTECVNRHKLKTYNYHNIYSYTETRNLVSFFNEQTIKSDIIHFAQFNRYGIVDYIPNIIEDIKRGTDIKKINKKIFDLRFKR